MKIYLYFPKDKNIKEINKDKVIDDLYYNLATIPTDKELKQYKITSNELKEYISKLSYKIPLFDYQTKNLYLVEEDDIYTKVVNYSYRFPNQKIIKLLEKTVDNLETNTTSNWITNYIEKIKKNLNFLRNYDLDILENTYNETFINTNPTSRELTSCIKPSYLPYQKYQSPYYTKSEIISMALNLGLIKNKDFKQKDFDFLKTCNMLKEYEIDTKMLIYNQLYILYNNAKGYVQFYSLYGSYYFNSYLRNQKSIKDLILDKHIDNFLKIIENAPAFEKEYEVYRFIESDQYLEHLKVGDILEERSFISTTRNPFYSIKDNQFGFILLKIRLPVNAKVLLMETYSNYPHEQEILLSPSRLKLIDINNDFKYYHWNKLAEKKIIKKYIFEYVEPLSYDINYYTKDYEYIEEKIELIDFYNKIYTGTTVLERTLNFFSLLPKINNRRTFESKIGLKTYKFNAYFLTQNKVYSKFFFLQKDDESNKILGDEIYLTIQNPDTANIELLVEIRNIISVNYYNRYSPTNIFIDDESLLEWLAGLAKALIIDKIIIHGNYSSYYHIVEKIIKKTNDKNLLEDFIPMQNIDNPDANILNLYTADINTYCIDLIDYIFYNNKRFSDKAYVVPNVPKHMIDNLKNITFISLYEKYNNDSIEDKYGTIYSIYKKLDNKITMLEFYEYIHLNYPYLIQKLQNLIILSYPINSKNPWHFMYIFKPFEYLYSKNKIKFILNSNNDKIDEMIKNLSEEVKFIHENKFRQI
jgi:hypothetical protein